MYSCIYPVVIEGLYFIAVCRYLLFKGKTRTTPFEVRCHLGPGCIGEQQYPAVSYPDSEVQGPTWGPSGADKTQVGPCWPQELCYLGIQLIIPLASVQYLRHAVSNCDTRARKPFPHNWPFVGGLPLQKGNNAYLWRCECFETLGHPYDVIVMIYAYSRALEQPFPCQS